MADFEDNGVLVSDDDSKDSTCLRGSLDKEETDTSNNSSSQKKGQSPAPKSGRSQSEKNGSYHNQSIRRSEILEQMKRRVYNRNADHTKAFLNFLARPNVDARDVKSKVFKNQLMLSESMDEVPTSFAKNWLMVACPVGSRCLVVANMGHTGAYTKTGYHIISHPSSLPMGNKTLQGYGSCVLDCVYCNENETYFVLDMMCWDGEPLYDYDTQARFRLLQDKIREYDLGRHSRQNPYPFLPLKTFTPTKSNICGAVRMAPYMIDGLLFYHKQGTYTPGSTPLVLWLTLDRLPTKMKIEIPEMGIITAVSYKDPVALALAHGVSPAIISQVYPGQNMRGQGRNPWGGQERYQEFGGHMSHGYYPRQEKRRPPRPAHLKDDYYLSDMMMGLNLMHGGLGSYGQYDRQYDRHVMGPSSGPMYNFNSNNSSIYYNRSPGGRGRFQQPQHVKSKPQKKKKKSPRQGAQDEPKSANWEEPHGVMKSQWMIAKPENFENDYLTCICPMAKRRIIVAANGKTCTYNKYGKLVDSFVSSLPNGSPNLASGERTDGDGNLSSDLTILDCLWCGSFQKFYVIDVMHWRQQPFYDAEAEFRFFWLADKITDVVLKTGKKEYGVEVLPKHPSNKESIIAALSKADYKVDGLLCFQRNSKYSQVAGVNALWLKVDMMEELFGYPPPQDVSFKPSSEKERKQRAYFMNLNNEKEDQSNAERSNSEEEFASPSQEYEP